MLRATRLAVIAGSTLCAIQLNAQDPEPQEKRYLLRPGRPEFTGLFGLHALESEGPETGAFVVGGADVGLGLSRRFSLHANYVAGHYRNDTYYNPTLPNNPYLTTASRSTATVGLRWEFPLGADWFRPWVEAGGGTTRMWNLKRGEPTLCVPSPTSAPPTCWDMAPTIFEGSRPIGSVAFGANVFTTKGIGGQVAFRFPFMSTPEGKQPSTQTFLMIGLVIRPWRTR